MLKKFAAAFAAMSLVCAIVVPAQAQTREELAEERKRLGSHYLRCDGEPNNMTGGEGFARLIGAATLLGIFAPAPETPDPSKRLFAEKGVEACTYLIDGGKAEGNVIRRIPLILARALHQIEAKNYAAALADVAKARAEAEAADLVGNPYFDRSMGLSFSLIEGEAKLRMGDVVGAQRASLAPVEGMRYSYVPILLSYDYSAYMREVTELAQRRFEALGRIYPTFLSEHGWRLQEVGEFGKAADLFAAEIAYLEGFNLEPKETPSSIYAHAALAHALAGKWDIADKWAQFAKTNMERRKADGVPEDNSSSIVEVLDLYNIVKMVEEGDIKSARRNFAARSKWVSPSFGAVLEMTRRLRAEASEDELFGSLSESAEAKWQKRYDEAMAYELQQDTENESLFGNIRSYAQIREYERQSKLVWRTKKSKMMSKATDTEGGWTITFSRGGTLITIAADAIMLHAALQAKARGKEGFTMSLLPGEYSWRGFTRFVNRDEAIGGDVRFVPADEVIAELSQLIPSPDELKLRKKKRK